MDIHAEVLAVCLQPNPELPQFSRRNQPYVVASQILQRACIDLDALLPDSALSDNGFCHLTFFWDEARVYLDPVEPENSESRSFFHYIRLAMFFFPRNLNKLRLVAAFLDTFGNVANYAPAEIPDPSLRSVDASGIYKPFISLTHQSAENLVLPVDIPSATQTLFNSGRELWKTYETVAEVLSIASYKLLCSSRFGTPSACIQEQSLAVLGARAAITFHTQEKLSLSLVQSHGASLYAVSKDRSILLIGYPSEPALAAAAAWITMVDPKIWDVILDVLNDSLLAGMVEAGPRGELAARILLLMAMDYARCPIYSATIDPVVHFRPILAREFLESLLGGAQSMNNLIGDQWTTDQKTLFLSGIMNFTHFIYADYSPSKNDMKIFFTNSAAILCKRGQSVYDLILPVYMETCGRYSYILVQVHNYASSTGLSQLPDDIESKGGLRRAGLVDFVEDPFIYLFLQLGRRVKPQCRRLFINQPSQKPTLEPCNTQLVLSPPVETQGAQAQAEVVEAKPQPSANPPSHVGRVCLIGIFGIDSNVYPFLTARQCTQLSDISRARVDPVSFVKKCGFAGSQEVAILQDLVRVSLPPQPPL